MKQAIKESFNFGDSNLEIAFERTEGKRRIHAASWR